MVIEDVEGNIEVIHAESGGDLIQTDSLQIVPCIPSTIAESDVSSPRVRESMSKNLSPGWRASRLVTPISASIESVVPEESASVRVTRVVSQSSEALSDRSNGLGSQWMHKGSSVSRSNQRSTEVREKAMFVDTAAMKAKLRETMIQKNYDVKDYYKQGGICQAIATNKHFESITLCVITFNAFWMWIDTDWNNNVLWEAPPVFQVAEHSFCAFYAFEWFVRFGSFKDKRDGLKDAWFVFDTILVAFTVLETWVVNFIMMAINSGSESGMGSTVILRMARLLRLSRMARMARLFRVMPEIMILIKGMLAACRSVLFTMALLVILIYIFAIGFTQLTSESEMGQQYFKTVPASMVTLLLYGTLLDEIGAITYDIAEENTIYAFVFMVFVVLTALTVMNMLIGILCEIVSDVASVEKERMVVSFVKNKMEELLSSGIDQDDDRMISKDEFVHLLGNQQATACLQECGVDVLGLVDFADFIFESDDHSEEGESLEKELDFAEFMDIVLQLRGSNNASVKDVVDLRKYIRNKHKEVFKVLSEREKNWRSATMQLGSEEEETNEKNNNAVDNHGVANRATGRAEDQSDLYSRLPPRESTMSPPSPRERAQPLFTIESVEGADPESTPELNNEALHNRMEKLTRLIRNGSQSLRELRQRQENVERIMVDAENELSSLREIIERRGRNF